MVYVLFRGPFEALSRPVVDMPVTWGLPFAAGRRRARHLGASVLSLPGPVPSLEDRPFSERHRYHGPDHMAAVPRRPRLGRATADVPCGRTLFIYFGEPDRRRTVTRPLIGESAVSQSQADAPRMDPTPINQFFTVDRGRMPLEFEPGKRLLPPHADAGPARGPHEARGVHA